MRRRVKAWLWRRYLRRHGATYRWPGEIMCFHCGRRFRSYWRARLHFGETPRDGGAACAVKPAEVERMRGRMARLERELAEAARELKRLGVKWPRT